MINESACKHLAPQPDLKVVMVLRFEFYLREAITECAQCGAFYLIKAKDFFEKSVLYDVSKLPPENTKKTIESVNRGSCNINRAIDELSYLQSQISPCDYMVISQNGEFTLTIPRRGLRTLSETKNWLDQSSKRSQEEQLSLNGQTH